MVRLRRVSPDSPGWTRRRAGKGFTYLDEDGARLPAEEVERIKKLAIPPAWKDVWICPRANGHIQAVGTDAAGRRQYLYHQKWQQERNEEKFDRVLEMSAALPQMRRQIAADLGGRGLSRDRVLAVALHLLDLGYFRAGSEQYAEENNSFGIATLLCEHVTVQRNAIEFDFPAKSGVRRTLTIDEPTAVRSVRALLRRPERTERLLVCRNGSGWTDLHADDLNTRFKELVGDQYSVKDLRTWHGTVLAAAAFVDADPPVNKTVIKRVESAVMKEVAEELGNTPAVARASYVDPRVVEGYESNLTIAPAVRRAQRMKTPADRQEVLDRSTARLIRRVARNQ